MKVVGADIVEVAPGTVQAHDQRPFESTNDFRLTGYDTQGDRISTVEYIMLTFAR